MRYKRRREATKFIALNSKGRSDGALYYGRTSGSKNEDCITAVARRDLGHQVLNVRYNFLPAVPDRKGLGSNSSDQISGREQQLIDQHIQDVPMPWPPLVHGIDFSVFKRPTALPNAKLFNKIRGVKRANRDGCNYHFAANAQFTEKAPFTGFTSFPGCAGINTVRP